jgi:hypothetical protein
MGVRGGMGKLLEGAIYVASWAPVPWHDYNVNIHLSYSPSLRETTLTLFTKDHQKVFKITDEAHAKLDTAYERNNWCLRRKEEWQQDLKTLYQNMGD